MNGMSQGSLELLALFALIGYFGTLTIVLPLLSTIYSFVRGIAIWRGAGKHTTFDEKVERLNQRL